MCAIYSRWDLRFPPINWVPYFRNRGPNLVRFFGGSHPGHHQGQFYWKFCVAYFFGVRHFAAVTVEVLACQASPLLDSPRVGPQRKVMAAVRARHLPCSIQKQASRGMGAAGCTAGFRPAHAHLRARLGRCQPYAPAGWRGRSGKVRVLPEFLWPSSGLNCRTTPKEAFNFDVCFWG